jgi:hypothetical protein
MSESSAVQDDTDLLSVAAHRPLPYARQTTAAKVESVQCFLIRWAAKHPSRPGCGVGRAYPGGATQPIRQLSKFDDVWLWHPNKHVPHFRSVDITFVSATSGLGLCATVITVLSAHIEPAGALTHPVIMQACTSPPLIEHPRMQWPQPGFVAIKPDVATALSLAREIAMKVAASHALVGIEDVAAVLGAGGIEDVAAVLGAGGIEDVAAVLGAGGLKYASGTPVAARPVACLRRPHGTVHGTDVVPPHAFAPHRVSSTIWFVRTEKQKIGCVPAPHSLPICVCITVHAPPGLHWYSDAAGIAGTGCAAFGVADPDTRHSDHSAAAHPYLCGSPNVSTHSTAYTAVVRTAGWRQYSGRTGL